MTRHRQPRFDADGFLRRLWAMDVVLVNAGFHPLSDWWRAEITRFIRALAKGRVGAAQAMVRRWVIRAGRRAGKSSAMCRLAVAWALWGPWHVPAGDIAVVAFVSVSKDESGARLRTIETILEALDEPFEERGEEIELTGARPCLFKTFACTVRSVVGPTCIMVVGDEVARWESRDGMANPAPEVFGSLLPTLASQPFGFSVMSSSPWSTDDYHAQRFDEGDTAHQIVSFAPTWVANPTITEDDTRVLEPDERTRLREYAAEPGGTLSQAFDAADHLPCYTRRPAGKLERAFVAIDASSLRGDAFSYIAGEETDQGELVVLEADGWEDAQLHGLTMDAVVDHIAARARKWRTSLVFGDQREEASLRAMFSQRGITFRSYAWTEQSKDDAIMRLRRMMREKKLVLCDHPRLRSELSGLKARLMPSGRVRYDTNGRDYASALITLAHAVVDGAVLPECVDSGEPIFIPSPRGWGRSSSSSNSPRVTHHGPGKYSIEY